MPSLHIELSQRRPFGRNWRGAQTLVEIVNQLQSMLAGKRQCDMLSVAVNDTAASGNVNAHAVGVHVMSGLTGTVGLTLAGVLTTVTAAGGDVASTSLIAAALRNAASNGAAFAVNRIAQVTLASVTAGSTITIFGITFTAVNGATTVAPGNALFDMSGTDTADATSLALAINTHPALVGRCRAVNSAGVLYVGLMEDRAADIRRNEQIILPTGAGFTVNVAVPVAAAVLMVFASVPGLIGNEVRSVASGTGVGALVTNGTAGLLGHGRGGNVPIIQNLSY